MRRGGAPALAQLRQKSEKPVAEIGGEVCVDVNDLLVFVDLNGIVEAQQILLVIFRG
jgi:hypothetical protein